MTTINSSTYSPSSNIDLEGQQPSAFSRATIRLNTKATETLSKIYYFCSEGSIFHALDSARLEKDKAEYKDAPYFSNVTVGISLGARSIFQGIILSGIIHSLVDNISGETSTDLSSMGFTTVVVVAPIFEEIIFRLIIQNGIALVQNTALEHAPESFKENRVFVWLTSTSCRIVIANSLFAAAHLVNGGGYLTVAGAVVQVALIMFRTEQSVGYEITGSFITPVVAHMTNNAIVWGIIQLAAQKA